MSNHRRGKVLSALTGLALLFLIYQNFTVAELNNAINNNAGGAFDYLIQDVCVNTADKPIAGDPASCAKHRSIRIGEKLPYALTDFAPGNGRYQAVHSYPVRGKDGNLMVLVSKDFENNSGFSPAYSFQYKPFVTGLHDGFDLLETNGSHIAAIRTSDGGCGDQIIKRNAGQRDDGWIFFPIYGSGSGGQAHTIRIETQKPTLDCPAVREDTQGFTYDVWDRTPLLVPYTGGKNLMSIISYHFAHYNLAQNDNALERFFFTREYGFTRWESWEPLSRCLAEKAAGFDRHCNDANQFLAGRCNNVNYDYWGNQTWVRTDCHDNTNYLAVNTPFIPLAYGMADSDIDVAGTLAGVPAGTTGSGGGGGTVPTPTPQPPAPTPTPQPPPSTPQPPRGRETPTPTPTPAPRGPVSTPTPQPTPQPRGR